MTRTTRTAAASLWLLLAPSWSTAASPQLFKCVEGGRTVYQQHACPVTAQIEAAASAPRASKASETPAKFAAGLKPSSPPASSAPATPR